MIINNFNNIIDHSLAFLKDDYTELWVIVGAIATANPQLSFPEILEATKDVLSYLVTHHNLTVVDVETEKPLIMEKSEILRLVENNLNKLKRMPDIGDGVWMTVLIENSA